VKISQKKYQSNRMATNTAAAVPEFDIAAR
jgi:hypothetical protein